MDKQAIREAVWDALGTDGIARFPFPPHGRIPNFEGATAAAERLADLPEWRETTALKANPDAPQLPARRAALREGKTVYMAVPRLREETCFVELDPAALSETDAAATVGGMDDHGRRVVPDDLPHIDLILVGSVAVCEAGDRIGKGEGYSDVEFAVLRELGFVDETTTVVTTVHERQVVDAPFSTANHDVPLDIVVTPERTIRTGATGRPDGIDWTLLDEERIGEMPVLKRFRE